MRAPSSGTDAMPTSVRARHIDEDAGLARYSRQMLFDAISECGQRALLASRVTLIGCGALGTVIADTLVRAGVGFLRIVDRDFVEMNNLQRQVLFDERDAADGIPKAVAAAQKLSAANSTVTIEPVVADAHPGTIETYIDGAQLILDGTDNFETRFLINDVAVKHGLPWIYGACVAATGMVMPIVPRLTPCLRCIWEQPPPPGMSPTCDTAGVLAPVVHLVAALQCVEAVKVLTGKIEQLSRKLIQIDAWAGRFEAFDLQNALESGDCPCCKGRRFDYLNSSGGSRTASLCGRDAVQIGASGSDVDLQAVSARVAAVAKFPPQINRYLLRFKVEDYEITLFRDGRAIIKGTHEPDTARSVYAKYIGN